MKTQPLKDKFRRFKESLTDSEYDLFTINCPYYYRIENLKAEIPDE